MLQCYGLCVRPKYSRACTGIPQPAAVYVGGGGRGDAVVIQVVRVWF